MVEPRAAARKPAGYTPARWAAAISAFSAGFRRLAMTYSRWRGSKARRCGGDQGKRARSRSARLLLAGVAPATGRDRAGPGGRRPCVSPRTGGTSMSLTDERHRRLHLPGVWGRPTRWGYRALAVLVAGAELDTVFLRIASRKGFRLREPADWRPEFPRAHQPLPTTWISFENMRPTGRQQGGNQPISGPRHDRRNPVLR